jgi:hypothetical protein
LKKGIVADEEGVSSFAHKSREGQEFQSLCGQFANEKIDTCQVAVRSRDARDKTKLNRVFGNAEDNGNCRGGRLGRERHRRASPGGDYRDASANQFGS